MNYSYFNNSISMHFPQLGGEIEEEGTRHELKAIY